MRGAAGEFGGTTGCGCAAALPCDRPDGPSTAPVAVELPTVAPSSFDAAQAAWLNQRLRLYRCILRDGRKLLWERVRESGPERRRAQKEGLSGAVMERQWEAEYSTGSPLMCFDDTEGSSQVNAERPYALPGWRLEAEAGTRSLGNGRTPLYQRVWAIPDPGPSGEQQARGSGLRGVPHSKRAPGVTLGEEQVRVVLRLRDREALPSLPSRVPGELAWAEGHRSSPRGSHRSEVLAQIVRKREV